MRLCRFEMDGRNSVGLYSEDGVLPLQAAAESQGITLEVADGLLEFLPGGNQHERFQKLCQGLASLMDEELFPMKIPLDEMQLRVPVPRPSKIMLLAGNYSKHIEEGGGRAEERARTFPYVFMKPPGTTLTHPDDPVRLPAISPDCIDWELELGVIIGRTCRGVRESDALDYVAGYTVINDISDRRFRPNPDRSVREKDGFFDWLHGKWHDTFCPVGPCVLPADECDDPQKLRLELRVNDGIEQQSSTAEMVFPVAGIIEFLSSFVTLEPGDLISTGTPHGVGAAKGKFLRSGDVLEAEIGGIGVLRNPVVAE